MTKKGASGHFFRTWGFLLCVIVVYVFLLVTAPDRTFIALRTSLHVLLQVILPLLIAFAMMFLLNFFVKPEHVSRFLGRVSGIKGIMLSSAAGILSMGPVYAWYPLLKTLKDKGAADFHLANFLSNRAIKPFLLPLMVFYFGWIFTLILTVFSVLGALLIASVVNLLGSAKHRK